MLTDINYSLNRHKNWEKIDELLRMYKLMKNVKYTEAEINGVIKNVI